MNEQNEYCLNCGNECHVGILKRTEKGYASEGSNEYEIIVCYHCIPGTAEDIK